MTITTTDTVERYVGDGTQTAWPIRFPFFKGEDVKACIVNSAGEQVNLVYGSEYTVTKSTGSIGGTLNYALANDVVLTIWLSLPITQGADFYNTGPLNAETLEASFDRLTLIAQQLQEASDRSVKVKNSSTETPEQLLTSLYASRDTAVTSASAAATSESNALASMQAAATSETNAATSKTAAADSAIMAETWAESETPPDPNNAESKSAKTWALIAGDSVPIASTNLAGKAKTSASWQVDSETGVATVPDATTELAGIARQATDAEVEAGTEGGPVFMSPYDVQTKIDALATDVNDDMGGKADVDLSNVTATGKATAVGWGIPDYSAGVAITTNHTVTTPSLIYACPSNATNTISYLYIDNVEVGYSMKGSQAGNANTITALASAGSVITFTLMYSATIFPLIGGNNE